MKKSIILLIGCMMIFLAGCGEKKKLSYVGNQQQEEESGGDTEGIEANAQDMEAVTEDDKEDAAKLGTEFKDLYVDGNLYYTVTGCNIYDNLKEAGIKEEELLEPNNIYISYDIGEKYRKISDFIQEDGTLVDTHRLVILDMKIRNEDAVGSVKKKEFTIYGVNLFGSGSAELMQTFFPAYFDKGGKVDKEQFFYYELEQGKEINIKLGFLVWKDDIEKLFGEVDGAKFQIY